MTADRPSSRGPFPPHPRPGRVEGRCWGLPTAGPGGDAPGPPPCPAVRAWVQGGTTGHRPGSGPLEEARKGPTPGPAGGPARGVLAPELSFVGLCHGTPGNGTTGLGGGDASGPSPGAGEFPAPLGQSLDPLCSYVPHPARSPGTEASPAPGPTPPEPGHARPPSLARADSPTRLPVFLRAPPAPSAPQDWLGAPTSALTYVLGLGPPPRQARRCMGRGVTGAGPDLSWPGAEQAWRLQWELTQAAPVVPLPPRNGGGRAPGRALLGRWMRRPQASCPVGGVSISVPAAVLGGGVLPGAPLPRHGSPERQRGTVRRAAAHPAGPHPLLLLCPSAPPCAASSEPAASVSPPRDSGSSHSLSGQHLAAGRESSRHPGQAGPCKSWLLIVALGLGG